ncbi:MAG: CvpA family protein [Burkholderiaceae bacterium]
MSLLTGWDFFVGLVILLSVGFGVVRGLIRTVFALAAWIAAVVGTGVSWPFAVQALSMQEHAWVVVILLFLGIFLLVRMIGRWLANGLKAVGLGGLDRLLGAGLGIARAAILIALAVLAAKSTGLDQQPSFQQALCRPMLEQTWRWLEPYLPENMTGLRQV